jgi:hypothetical protein
VEEKNQPQSPAPRIAQSRLRSPHAWSWSIKDSSGKRDTNVLKAAAVLDELHCALGNRRAKPESLQAQLQDFHTSLSSELEAENAARDSVKTQFLNSQGWGNSISSLLEGLFQHRSETLAEAHNQFKSSLPQPRTLSVGERWHRPLLSHNQDPGFALRDY